MSKSIYNLELFEEKVIFSGYSEQGTIRRVPGGWIYIQWNDKGTISCFIPFNTEFKKEQ